MWPPVFLGELSRRANRRNRKPTVLTAAPPLLRAGESLVGRQALVSLIRGRTVRYRNETNSRLIAMTPIDGGSDVVVTSSQVNGGGKQTRHTGSYSISESGRYCHVLKGDPNNHCCYAVKSGSKHFLIWDDTGEHRSLLEE
jgi:hypothetical protein